VGGICREIHRQTLMLFPGSCTASFKDDTLLGIEDDAPGEPFGCFPIVENVLDKDVNIYPQPLLFQDMVFMF